MVLSHCSLFRDQQHSPSCVPARGIKASHQWSLMLLLITSSIFFRIGDCSQHDIDCLRSIKESLQDPLNELSSWQFNNNPGQSNDSFCSFTGVVCWGGVFGHVLSIRLSGMGLRGEFPSGIASCSALTGLDLSNNQLYGSIPSNISKLTGFLTVLDLSHNNFSGEIPSDIANLTFLNVLRLNNNLLTGHIPSNIVTLNRLKIFTVANNLLSGPVPEFPTSDFSPESYANNAGLCGTPLEPCKKKARKDSNTLFISGFFVGWAVFCTLFFAIGLFTSVDKIVIKLMKRQVRATPRIEPLRSRERFDTKISTLEKFATRMSFLELSKATDNFSENNVIASGELGTTYKAELSNGWCLAIKRLSAAPHIEHEFLMEIMTLGRLRHSNLVPLIGFCHELNDRFLIYKFMPKGSLHDCLFSSNGESNTMEWPLRVRIAVGIAKGIAWLHQNRVVHRGISSQCVLLDHNFEPRISDFGKATSAVTNGELSVYMEDVYSFGIVLLELFTGTKYSEIISTFGIDAGDIFQDICHLLNEPHVLGVYAQSMIEQGLDVELIHFLRIASKCVECDPGNWPSMEEVYHMLIGTKNHER